MQCLMFPYLTLTLGMDFPSTFNERRSPDQQIHSDFVDTMAPQIE